MANNVIFLQGQENNLNNLVTSESAQPGYFYFIDGHNLYIGIRQDGAGEDPVGSVKLLNNDIHIAGNETDPKDISQVHYDEYWYLPETHTLWHCNELENDEKGWETIFSFPYDFNIKINNNGNLVISYTDGEETIEATSPQQVYTKNQVYTKQQVDDKIADATRNIMNSINGMTFKGAVPNNGLPTTMVSIGDTYIVVTDGAYDEQQAVVGDLFIAAGTENSEGYITPSTLQWTYVPSGNDTYWEPFDRLTT